MASLSSASAAARIVSQSEVEPMMMPTSGFIAEYYLCKAFPSGRSVKQAAHRAEQLARRRFAAAGIHALTGRLVDQRLQGLAVGAGTPAHELVERRGTVGQQACAPGLDPFVFLGLGGGAARFRAQRGFDRHRVDVAHEFDDVLALARKPAAGGDAFREHNGVEQLLRQPERREVGFLQRDQPLSEVLGRRRLALARTLARSFLEFAIFFVVLHRTILPCNPRFDRRPFSRARKSTVPASPSSRTSCPTRWRTPGTSAHRRPRRMSACRRGSRPPCVWAKWRRSNTSAIAAWASRCTSASARVRRVPPTCRRAPCPRPWRKPATSPGTRRKTNARGWRTRRNWRATSRISTWIIPGRFRPNRRWNARASARPPAASSIRGSPTPKAPPSPATGECGCTAIRTASSPGIPPPATA